MKDVIECKSNWRSISWFSWIDHSIFCANFPFVHQFSEFTVRYFNVANFNIVFAQNMTVHGIFGHSIQTHFVCFRFRCPLKADASNLFVQYLHRTHSLPSSFSSSSQKSSDLPKLMFSFALFNLQLVIRQLIVAEVICHQWIYLVFLHTNSIRKDIFLL